jgi:hypothetical protein
MSSAANLQSKKVVLTVRVDKNNLNIVKEYAKRTDTTVSQLVRDFFQYLIVEIDRISESDLEQI